MTRATPRELCSQCYEFRTFARFAVPLGLAESQPIAGEKSCGPREVRKTPALDGFVRFTV